MGAQCGILGFTRLRNKAVRGKAFSVKQACGANAYEEFTPAALLRMGKAQMTRVLTAYEQALPGSAAEKLAQRSDLEAMLNQVETESLVAAHAAMHSKINAVREALAEWEANTGSDGDDSAPKEVLSARKLVTDAVAHLASVTEDAEENDVTTGDAGSVRSDDPLAALRDRNSDLLATLREAQQGGSVPAHFVTLTTAIYHWSDLALLLERCEDSTTRLRGGRVDPLEPGEALGMERGLLDVWSGWHWIIRRSLDTHMSQPAASHDRS